MKGILLVVGGSCIYTEKVTVNILFLDFLDRFFVGNVSI